MRRALLVGIDDYNFEPLAGCVNDATRMAGVLGRHDGGSPNFSCRLLTSGPQQVTRGLLRRYVEELFAQPADVALLYFSGHGTVNNLGGYLVTQDAAAYDEGMAMRDVLHLANQSPVAEVVIVLDCCHSGALGNLPAVENNQAVLREGVSVLTSSRAAQLSIEARGGGIFTTLVCEALTGGAADVAGRVTVASVYAFVDQALGPWDQRPLFKSHVSQLLSLRDCRPEVPLEVLREIPSYFPTPDHELPLDPSYEPSAEPLGHPNEQIFAKLQQLRSARLLVPVGADHLYYAAIQSRACRLTALGRHYRKLASEGRL